MHAYEAPTVAGTGVFPGTKLLADALARAIGIPAFGGYSRRCIAQCGAPVNVGNDKCSNGHGISHHAESTAVDVMTPDPDMHKKVVGWALTEGIRWEVQEIITGLAFDAGPMRWTPDGGWHPYSGPSAHKDHVHLSQTHAAAAWTSPPQETSMYMLVRLFGFWDTLLITPAGKVIVPQPGGPGLQEINDQGLLKAGVPKQGWNEAVVVFHDRNAWNMVTDGFNPTTPSGE